MKCIDSIIHLRQRQHRGYDLDVMSDWYMNFRRLVPAILWERSHIITNLENKPK